MHLRPPLDATVEGLLHLPTIDNSTRIVQQRHIDQTAAAEFSSTFQIGPCTSAREAASEHDPAPSRDKSHGRGTEIGRRPAVAFLKTIVMRERNVRPLLSSPTRATPIRDILKSIDSCKEVERFWRSSI